MTTHRNISETYQWDWADLAFASKKPINSLKATFIAAPRDISVKRFTELVKAYLPSSNIVLGIAREPYVLGFDNQPQFKTLALPSVQPIIDKINSSSISQKVYVLSYFQRETNYVLQKLNFRQALFINGSWQYAFHTRDVFYTLTNHGIPYRLLPAFCNEREALAYEKGAIKALSRAFPLPATGADLNELQMMQVAQDAAKHSFDYNFQTGLSLGKVTRRGTYRFLAATQNRIVPYETYALLNGASRETHYSPPHDLNHYDTVHAEVGILVTALQNKLNLAGATIFINLLPCPPCSRMLCQTPIAELVYQHDHSDGYAVQMLQLAGKKVRRLVP